MIIVITLLLITMLLPGLSYSGILFIAIRVRHSTTSSTVSPSLQRMATTEHCIYYAGCPLITAFFIALVHEVLCRPVHETWLAGGFYASHSTSTLACLFLWPISSLLSPWAMEVLAFLVSVGHSFFQISKSHSHSMLTLSPGSLTGY